MNLYFLIFMGFFLGVSWLLRIAVSERISEKVREGTDGNSCQSY